MRCLPRHWSRSRKSIILPHRARPNLLVKATKSKQMFVPILLVTGLFLIVAAVVKLVVTEDSPLYDKPGWISPVLIVLGLGFLAVAVLNMLSIRATLAAQGR